MKNKKEEETEKENRGGPRDGSGRKPWDHDLSVMRRLRAEAWFAQLTKDGGSVQDLIYSFKNTDWGKEALNKVPEHKNKDKKTSKKKESEVFPSQDRLYKYRAGESGPGNDTFPKRIGLFFPESLKTWESNIWEAANDPERHMEKMEREYRRTINVYSIGYTKGELEDDHKLDEEDRQGLGINTFNNLEEYWEDRFDGNPANGIEMIKLPRSVTNNFPNMNYIKNETCYLPNNCHTELDWDLRQIDMEYRHQAMPEPLKAQIRCYLEYRLISSEKAVSDILSIDIASQIPISLTESEISSLPEGILRIYDRLPEAMRVLYTARKRN